MFPAPAASIAPLRPISLPMNFHVCRSGIPGTSFTLRVYDQSRLPAFIPTPFSGRNNHKKCTHPRIAFLRGVSRVNSVCAGTATDAHSSTDGGAIGEQESSPKPKGFSGKKKKKKATASDSEFDSRPLAEAVSEELDSYLADFEELQNNPIKQLESVHERVPNELLAAKPKKTKKNAPLAHVEGATGKNQRHVFTRSGRPLVHDSIRYNELLRAIRSKEVKELVMAQQGADRVGVVFKSGVVKMVQLPSDDCAVADMMSVHGVPCVLTKTEPPPPPSADNSLSRNIASYWLPTAMILAVYGVVVYRSRQKGDWEDRIKLRKLDAQKEREKRQQKELQAAEGIEREFLRKSIAGIEESMDQGELDEEDQAVNQALDDAKKFMRTNAQVSLTGRTGRSTTGGKEDKRVTFDEVAGIGDAKVELMEVVDFFKKPEKYRASGSRIPRGVLLCGPPGTGKTLLARAVAGESGVAFFSMTASEFVEMFVGVGAARVRDLFAQARKSAPAIVFIDELDAVGRKRGGGGGGNDERDQTLNQMLSELDGFSETSSIVVMAATNRPDVLDPALIRPGRFDRKVVIGPPDALGRLEILKVHVASKPVGEDVDLKEIAYATTGFTGAALANIVNLAALVAAKDQRTTIVQADMFSALELETMGKIVDETPSDARRRRLAVHESAKAILVELLPSLETVELVTVVPREKQPDGQLRLEINEARTRCGTFSRQYLHEQMVALMGSRAAEFLVYGVEEMSTLNEDALDRARQVAVKMAATAGMSDNPKISHRTTHLPKMSGSYLGNATMMYQFSHVTTQTTELVNATVSESLLESYLEAKELLSKHRQLLDTVVEMLLAQGTVTGDLLRSTMHEHGVVLHGKQTSLDQMALDAARV